MTVARRQMSVDQSAGEQEDEAYEEDVTGFYRMRSTTSVKHGMRVSSATVTNIYAGTTVEVLEVVICDEDQRIRARIKEPAGWISLSNTEYTQFWAVKEVDHFDVEAAATCKEVLGHLHSIPARVSFQTSEERQYGKADIPPGLSLRIISSNGMKERSGKGPNQDAYSYTHVIGNWIICVVCDGHGLYGEVVAQRVAIMIPLLLSQLLPSGFNPMDALGVAFNQTQEHLERSLEEEQFISGATVAACLFNVESSECWFANCGDSTLMLGDLSTGAVVARSKDHYAHDPVELARLKEYGAKVLIKEYDDEKTVSRVFIPDTEVPGLAMSRALGDGCLKDWGVTAEPEIINVTEEWASCQTPAVVLASDGLWNMVPCEEVFAGLHRRHKFGSEVTGHVLLGVEALCRRAQETMANMHLGGDGYAYCDDTTIALLTLRPRD